jgi:glycosyltransferase involved in cell wall biosynthesis
MGRIHPRLKALTEELLASFAMLLRTISFRPDVVHGNDVNTLLPAWIGARVSLGKLVYDAHEISADREGYRSRIHLVKFLESRLGNRADARLTTTRMRADWFESNYGFQNVRVVQNRPVYIDCSSNLIRQRLPIPDEAMVVLYQGGLQPGRGLRNLIQSMERVRDVHLVMVGEGGQKRELEQLAARQNCVHFVGQVSLDELPHWTASADVGVQVLRNTCLNHYTTDSNKLFEYVMAGLPVIASDFPEIRAIVEPWGLGILVDPDDVGAISNAISRLRADAGLREQLAANARYARSELDWSSQEPVLLDAYRESLFGS